MNPLTPAPRFDAQPLAADELRRAAPSVFAEHARPGVSARYTFVSTAQVLDLLRGEGWEPVAARQQRVRLESRAGFQMHELRFARRDDLARTDFDVGHLRPELILQNAHDGSRAYRIDAGLFRLACRNGLVVADAAFAHVALRHVDLSPDKFAGAAQAVAATAPQVLDAVARWQSIHLAASAQEEFVRRAAALRWGADRPVARSLDSRQLLVPVRAGDDPLNLWTLFNVVQEHLLRGGDRYVGQTARAGMRRNTTRAVNGLAQGRSLNKALWALAEEFSRN